MAVTWELTCRQLHGEPEPKRGTHASPRVYGAAGRISTAAALLAETEDMAGLLAIAGQVRLQTHGFVTLEFLVLAQGCDKVYRGGGSRAKRARGWRGGFQEKGYLTRSSNVNWVAE